MKVRCRTIHTIPTPLSPILSSESDLDGRACAAEPLTSTQGASAVRIRRRTSRTDAPIETDVCMSTSQVTHRPWYCPDRLTDDYLRVHAEGGDLKMLKALKILRAIVVNVGIVLITVYALLEGADATIIGGIGLVSLAAYNGVEIVDYTALAQAILEVNARDDEE